jgi:TetR/AcrR family transcriptional regulator, transcriptional repressor of aconitase
LPKVSQKYLDSRRSEILDAALVCFSNDGFHRTTMQDIVRQSGLSPGAIYNYFKSKEEIVEAIAGQRQLKEKYFVMDAIGAGPDDAALERLRDAFLDELDEPKERLRRRVSVQLWAEAQRNPDIRRLVRRSFEEPRKLICAALAAAQVQGAIAEGVDPDALACFLIAAFHGLVLQREWDDDFSVKPHQALLDLLLRAISSPPGSSEPDSTPRRIRTIEQRKSARSRKQPVLA